MSSNTQPLPAAQLMALADAMASAVGSHVICDAGLEGSHMERTLEAYRAARAASPVTLEEALLKEWHDRNREQSRGLTFAGPAQVAFHFRCTMGMLNHARTLAETDNARRLAGEGGAA